MEEEKLLRLIDANVDRAQEGLRLLEDMARFLLDDASLAEAFKELRHRVGAAVASAYRDLLAARRATEDVTAFANPPGEMRRADLEALVAANAKRTQESLRALEETAKLPLPDVALRPEPFKEARFALYDLERRLLGRLLRHDLRPKLWGLYVIVDPEVAQGRDLVAVAREAIAGGARIIQLRDKVDDKGEQLATARQLQQLCEDTGALFIMNDHVDVAAACGAHGVHVGQTDLPVAAARRLLPLGAIVGVSTSGNVELALAAQAEGADYVAVGVFPSPTKPPAQPFPPRLDVLRQVKEAVSVPVCAISGINADNVHLVMENGADMAAVISAVVGQPDVRAAASRLVERMEAYKASH
ncbi:MAG: thiamine phosphate synthase [Dehalococcoidia bacterium]